MSEKKKQESLEMITSTLKTYSPAIVGVVIASLTSNPVITNLAYFLAGFTGIIIIIRKESPTGRKIVRGKLAILHGLIITIAIWGTTLLILYLESK